MKTISFNDKLSNNIKRNYPFTLIQNIDLTRGIWISLTMGIAPIGFNCVSTRYLVH